MLKEVSATEGRRKDGRWAYGSIAETEPKVGGSADTSAAVQAADLREDSPTGYQNPAKVLRLGLCTSLGDSAGAGAGTVAGGMLSAIGQPRRNGPRMVRACVS